MADKPTLSAARWAELADGTPAANLTAAPSGQRDTGYTANQVPSSSELNDLLREHFRWLKYLSDGVFAGDSQFLNDVTTEDNLTANGVIQANGGIDVGANEHVILSGTGLYKRPAQRRRYQVTAGQVTDGGTGTWSPAAFNGASGDELTLPIIVNEGERITLIEVVVDPGATGTVDVGLGQTDESTGVTTSLGSASSSGTARQVVSVVPSGGGVTATPGSNVAFFVGIDFVGGSGQARSYFVTTEVP